MGQGLSRADPAALDKSLQGLFCQIGTRDECVTGQLRVGFRKTSLTGSAFPALDVALTEGTSLHADRVLASDTSHGLFSGCAEREKPYNHFGSGLRLTPRFGLALPGALTRDRAVFCYLVNWWGSGHGLAPFSLAAQ